MKAKKILVPIDFSPCSNAALGLAATMARDTGATLLLLHVDETPLLVAGGEYLDDVLQLADHFAGPDWEWEPRARETLTSYNWPGNVRQLINAIDRAKLLADEREIRFDNLPPEVTRGRAMPKGVPLADERDLVDLATLNRSFVVEAMKQESGNKSRAAAKLGVTRRSLYRLLEKYNIAPREYGSEVSESIESGNGH